MEKLEENDKDAMSELYMLPISGHKIMVAPGKSIMDTGIAYCYVYVIKQEKVVCKLGVYEKKSDNMPVFFDISTFPEGSFCLFEEYEKNPSKLIDLEMIEKLEKTETKHTYQLAGVNVFDYLIGEFSKIPNKKERIKGAYKNLYETYKELIKVDKEKKNKKMESILRIISEAGKDPDPKDTFLQTLKTNAEDKPVFVMTLLALQQVFLIDFTLVTDNDDYKKMKEDWPIANSTKDLEIDVDTYTILDPTYYPKETMEDVKEPESEEEPEAVEEAEPEAEPEPVDEPEAVEEAEPVEEAEEEAEAEPTVKPVSFSEDKNEPTQSKSVVSMQKSASEPKKQSTKMKSIPRQEEVKTVDPALYSASLSESTLGDIIKRTKSRKSSTTDSLLKNYESGKIPPSETASFEAALSKSLAKDLMSKSKKKVLSASKVVSAFASKAAAESEPTVPKSNIPTETNKIKKVRTIPKMKKTTE